MKANFHGTVDGQAGEAVAINVTFPDGTTQTLNTTILADNTFTITEPYTIAGTYRARAHVDASPSFTAWDSVERTFVVTLATRTGTFDVTLS